eukprot:361840-Chlamydomonas_euryale.AAC.19
MPLLLGSISSRTRCAFAIEFDEQRYLLTTASAAAYSTQVGHAPGRLPLPAAYPPPASKWPPGGRIVYLAYQCRADHCPSPLLALPCHTANCQTQMANPNGQPSGGWQQWPSPRGWHQWPSPAASPKCHEIHTKSYAKATKS